jgi:hypothetical protein
VKCIALAGGGIKCGNRPDDCRNPSRKNEEEV